MNQKTAKKIRRVAKELPPSIEQVYVDQEYYKRDLPPEEQKKVEHIKGDRVRYRGDVLLQIDHVKKLKAYHAKHGPGSNGELYIQKYLEWFVPHHIEMQKQHPDKMMVEVEVDADNQLKVVQ